MKNLERGDAADEQTATDAFVTALVSSQRSLFAYIGTLLPASADLEDVYQQTCLALWRKRELYDPLRGFLPWARGFARNEVLKHVQKRRHQRVYLSERVLDVIASESEQTESTSAARLEALDWCLTQLDSRQRAVLERCYQGNASIKSVAAEMGISAAALTMRLQRVRHTLAKCVEQRMTSTGDS